MNTSTKKILPEFTVHLRSWGAAALQAGQIRKGMDFGQKMNRVLSKAHIYVICRRPVLSFNPETFSFSHRQISGDLLYKAGGISQFLDFSFDFPFQSGEVSVVLSPYPHKEIWVLNEKQEKVRVLTAMELSQHPEFQKTGASFDDLEVLYIGNVFEEGGRSVYDRIKDKAVLQEMLLQMQAEMPDDEIMVYVFEYLPYDLVIMFGRLTLDTAASDSNERRFISVKAHPLTEHQKIALTQAGLIRYFQPQWNLTEKNLLRDEEKEVLQSCEELDIAGLIVEITTEKSNFRLYSKNATSQPRHMMMQNLIDPKERTAFFA